MEKAYKVLTIDQLVRSDAAEGLVKYYRHKILTKGGVVLSVNIKEEDFTPEKAAPLLLAAAENADKILKL